MLIFTVSNWMEPETLVYTVSYAENNYVFYAVIPIVYLAGSYNLDERDLDQRKLSVESSLVLDLPTHLVVPSANIKLNKTIGEGMILQF